MIAVATVSSTLDVLNASQRSDQGTRSSGIGGRRHRDSAPGATAATDETDRCGDGKRSSGSNGRRVDMFNNDVRCARANAGRGPWTPLERRRPSFNSRGHAAQRQDNQSEMRTASTPRAGAVSIYPSKRRGLQAVVNARRRHARERAGKAAPPLRGGASVQPEPHRKKRSPLSPPIRRAPLTERTTSVRPLARASGQSA